MNGHANATTVGLVIIPPPLRNPGVNFCEMIGNIKTLLQTFLILARRRRKIFEDFEPLKRCFKGKNDPRRQGWEGKY